MRQVQIRELALGIDVLSCEALVVVMHVSPLHLDGLVIENLRVFLMAAKLVH